MRKFLFLGLLMALLGFGCSNKPPACDSPEVKDKVSETIKQLVAETGVYGECFRPRLSDLTMFSDVSQLESVRQELNKACKKGKKGACNVLQCINKMLDINRYKLVELESDDKSRMCAVMEDGRLAFKYRLSKTSDGFLYEPMLF